MRIAILAAGEIFGGAERQILTLMSGVTAQLRVTPELLVFHEGDLAQRARALGVKVHVLGSGRRIDFAALGAMRDIFGQQRFDLISVHGYRATVYLALAGIARGTAVLKTEHGRIESGRGAWSERVKSAVYRWLENRAARRLNATCVYVTRDLQRESSDEHRGLTNLVIYNGIDAPDKAATRRPPEYRADRMNLVMVGRLDHVKAADLAIRAFADALMPPEAQLILVGSGPELESLRKLADELAVAARVDFLGFRANSFDYIAHADALLLPSRHEGLPYTLLEAMALGTAVIAARVGGLEEVLTAQRDALLVEPESPTAIARAVRQLADESQLRAHLVAAGTRLVNEKFSAASMTRNYLEAAGASIARSSS
jgi:glycosyltransferase involved in cell wall biosynthesis